MNRSLMFSILKCEFGWDGCIPDGLRWEYVEKYINKGECESCCADEVAVVLADHGASFSTRIDGRPNRRRVVGGVVVKGGA